MATNDNASEDLRLNKALEHLNSVLVTGETLEAWAIQRRLFALTNRRVLIAATSGRFIKIKRGLLRGYDMTDFRWQDLGDAKVSKRQTRRKMQLPNWNRPDKCSKRN